MELLIPLAPCNDALGLMIILSGQIPQCGREPHEAGILNGFCTCPVFLG